MYKAVIIGAGNIGAFFDSSSARAKVLTHAHAYSLHPKVELAAFCDKNKSKAVLAAREWGGVAYADVRTMLAKERPDIVSVCTPDASHAEILRLVIAHPPKAIFCEKPLTTNYKASQRIASLCDKKGILLAVNYTRRWESVIIDLRRAINSRRYGAPISAACTYNKGVLHNGSHAIDLMRYFFGEVKSHRALNKRVDWEKDDPTVDAFLKLERCDSVHLIGADCRRYPVFEIDILLEKRRITLSQGCNFVTEYKIGKNPIFPCRKALLVLKKEETSLKTAMKNAVDNIVRALKGAEAIISPASSAIKVQMICEGLIRDA